MAGFLLVVVNRGTSDSLISSDQRADEPYFPHCYGAIPTGYSL